MVGSCSIDKEFETSIAPEGSIEKEVAGSKKAKCHDVVSLCAGAFLPTSKRNCRQ